MQYLSRRRFLALAQTSIVALLVLTASIRTLTAAAESVPSFQWANTVNGQTLVTYSLKLDPNGNSYFTGLFSQSMQVGDVGFSNSSGMFVVTFDRTGNLRWAIQDGYLVGHGQALAIDSEQNVYALCQMSQPVRLSDTDVTGRVAIVKYDPSGRGLWAKPLVSTWTGYLDVTPEMAIDGTGNLYWTIYFTGTATIGETNLVSPTYGGALIKCDSSGNVQWVRGALGQNAGDFATMAGPALDSAGNAYVCGHFMQFCSFGTTNLTSQGRSDLFVAKYNPDGDLLWLRQSGGPGGDGSSGLFPSIDHSGNCFVTCSFFQSAAFGNLVLSNTIATQYIAVVKYDPSGNAVWARQVSEGYRSMVTTDPEGNSYVVADTPTNSLVYLKFDSDGNGTWSKITSSFLLWSLRADAIGHLYLLGNFSSMNTNAYLSLDSLVLTNQHSNDHFLLKLGTSGSPRLKARLDRDAVLVSWPVVADEFHLESIESVGDPQSWSTSRIVPLVEGGENRVSISDIGPAGFFRLKRH